MNNATKQARPEVIARCAATLKTLEANSAARKIDRGYAVLTTVETDAVKAMLNERGGDLFFDVSQRFLAAVRARCTPAVVKSVEDTYYYWCEELAERWAS
jgi:hypothetical protein